MGAKIDELLNEPLASMIKAYYGVDDIVDSLISLCESGKVDIARFVVEAAILWASVRSSSSLVFLVMSPKFRPRVCKVLGSANKKDVHYLVFASDDEMYCVKMVETSNNVVVYPCSLGEYKKASDIVGIHEEKSKTMPSNMAMLPIT